METKICKQCGETKSLFDFVKYKKSTDGYRKVCKVCRNKYSKTNVEKNREHYRNYLKTYREKNGKSEHSSLHSRLVSLLYGAKRRNSFEFSIDVDYLKDLWKAQNGLCAYTKLPLVIEPNQLNTVSIDRIDSSKGYLKGNVQLTCRAINEMKLDYSENQFIQLCHFVAQNNKQPDNPVELAVNREQI